MTARVNSKASGGAQRLAVWVEAAQTAGAVTHRVLTIEMPADQHPEPGAGAAAGLFGQLQRDETGGHDIVAPDDALILDAEDLVEIDPAEGNERRGGIRGRARELGVEGRQEAPTQVAIGGGDGANTCDTELVDEAVLQSAVDAFAPAARLGRMAEDVLDAEPGKCAADRRGLPAIGGAAGGGSVHRPSGRDRYRAPWASRSARGRRARRS